MIWLGIDTATRRGSVALAPAPRDVHLLHPGGGHAPELLGAIEALLARSGLASRDIAGIGVALGPGSFTGVRVGLSTAKGLGYALGVGLSGLSTLELLARAGEAPPGTLVCAAVEAGRGEVFTARFLVLEGGERERRSPDAAVTPSRLAQDLPDGTALVGDGAALVRSFAADRLHEVPYGPLAPVVAAWAHAAIPAGTPYRPGEPLPNYIRPSDGETRKGPA